MNLDTALQKISMLAELERLGLQAHSAGEGKVRCICPFHDDTNPSLVCDLEKRTFKCFSADCTIGNIGGDVITLVAKILHVTRAQAFADLCSRYKIVNAKAPIDPRTVQKYHVALLGFEPLLAELRKRGVSLETVQKYKLGKLGHRITIPITNGDSTVINIRKYAPGAPSSEKFFSSKGRGSNILWPNEQLKYTKVVVTGGEIKALAAIERLNKLKIGVVTATGGEGSWRPEFTKQLRKKQVAVCMDIDAAGVSGANAVCGHLFGHAASLCRIDLPLNRDDYPTGDLSDYFGNGATGMDFSRLWEKTEPWEPRVKRLTSFDANTDEPTRCSLIQAASASNISKRLSVSATVTAADPQSYSIPSKCVFSCGRDQKMCKLCPMYDTENDVEINIPAASIAVVSMMDCSSDKQRAIVLEGLGVPAGCRSADVNVSSWHDVYDTRVSPSLSITERDAGLKHARCIIVDSPADLNESYDLECIPFPHPKTQQTILIADKTVPLKDALSSWQPSDDMHERLELFKPKGNTSDAIVEKLDDIYRDISANVTRIFDRHHLHLFIDLAYHSPLAFVFDGQLTKGWTEILVIGDSAQGKSDTGKYLMNHYGLGEKVDCKNASVAGLLGGSIKHGDKWLTAWGIIPTHDKRLVMLEELKGASVEVLAKLTDMRSSGIAEIPKIDRRKTNARTRLIAFSNPRVGLNMASYSFGVNAVLELLGSPEDVRRFDAILGVSAIEIASDRINLLQSQRPVVEHKYTSALCRELILWIWTRDHEQVRFEHDAQHACLTAATRLCSEFTDEIPIVDKGSMRQKIARLAAAIAGRTFSCEHDVLIVRKCHVDVIESTLREVYNGEVLGYGDYSRAVQARSQMKPAAENAVKTRIKSTPYAESLVEHLLASDEIATRDIRDWCGYAFDDAVDFTAMLVRSGALVRHGREYRKTIPFINMLREMVARGELKDFAPPKDDEL